MRKLLFLIGIILFARQGPSQEAPDSVLSVEVSGEDWGISDWSSVRLSELSVLHGRFGNKLRAQLLTDSLPPKMSKQPKGVSPSRMGNCYLVSAFDRGSRNSLGGLYSTFSQAPSSARITLAGWERGRRALTLDFHRAGAGYCGMWIHLFDSRQSRENRVYLDLGNYAFLTFWIRGSNGNERILLKISDAEWEWKEDARALGEVKDFLPERRIDTNWQRAVVPLDRLPRDLNHRQLASLVFEAVWAESGRIAVKDLAFCRTSAPLPPLSSSPDSKKGEAKPQMAMWVWNTDEILPDTKKQESLTDFCLRHGIGHLYLQLPRGASPDAANEVQALDHRWQRFLALLADKGIGGFALHDYIGVRGILQPAQ